MQAKYTEVGKLHKASCAGTVLKDGPLLRTCCAVAILEAGPLHQTSCVVTIPMPALSRIVTVVKVFLGS